MLPEEQVRAAEEVVVRSPLTELTQRSAEVVSHDGDIVPVVRGLGFLERRQAAPWVRATVVHVVALQVAAGAELDEGNGVDVRRVDANAAVIARDHPAAQFAAEVRMASDVVAVSRLTTPELIRGDGGVGSRQPEDEGLAVLTRH